MQLNSIRLIPAGYEPPPLPAGLQGPEALSELLLHARRAAIGFHDGDGSWLAPLSDEAVTELVRTAYYASLLPEEGSFSRFKLVATASEGSSFLVSRMAPVLLDVGTLHRLAPACSGSECGLLVEQVNGDVFCVGVMNVGPMGFAVWPGRPGVVQVGRGPAFQIEVLNPGHILVSEVGSLSYELRGGSIRHVCPYRSPRAVGFLQQAIARRVKKEISHVDGSELAWISEDQRPFILDISRILRHAVDARHGGAFIFVPEMPSNGCDFGLDIQYLTPGLDLGDGIIQQWRAYLDFKKVFDGEGHDAAVRRAEILRHQVLTRSEAVGNFSAIDGCVVLTHDLRVVGFGAKIRVSSEESRQSPRRFRHLASETVIDDVDFMSGIGGTRHQSVARLCQAHPGVIVFTVSQDGELKLFHSDDEYAYVYGPLQLPSVGDEV